MGGEYVLQPWGTDGGGEQEGEGAWTSKQWGVMLWPSQYACGCEDAQSKARSSCDEVTTMGYGLRERGRGGRSRERERERGDNLPSQNGVGYMASDIMD